MARRSTVNLALACHFSERQEQLLVLTEKSYCYTQYCPLSTGSFVQVGLFDICGHLVHREPSFVEHTKMGNLEKEIERQHRENDKDINISRQKITSLDKLPTPLCMHEMLCNVEASTGMRVSLHAC
jgi:hypothetical protein